MKLFYLSLLTALALGALTTSTKAATYYHRVPAPVACPSTGCVKPAAALINPNYSPTGPQEPLGHAELSVASLDFGSLAAGTTSPTQTVTVSNTGLGTLQLTGVSVVEGTSDFAQSNNCGEPIPAGGSCDVAVAFTPSGGGARTGTLTVVGGGQNVVVSLTGNGLQAAGTLFAATSTDFGIVSVGGTSTLTVRYQNTGNATATGTYLALTGSSAVSIALNACGTPQAPKTIAVGGICNASLRYTPTTTGQAAVMATLYSPSLPAPSSVSLTGTGADPISAIDVSSIDFGSVFQGVDSAIRTVRLTNTSSTRTMRFSSVSGSNLQVQHDCGTSLAPNASCTLSFTFNLATLGQYSGTAIISVDRPLTIGVAAQVVASPTQLALSTSTADFGTVTQNVTTHKSLTLTNTSSTDSVSYYFETTGGLGLSYNCKSPMPPQSSCNIQLNLTPTTLGPYQGSVTVAGPQPLTVNVSAQVVQ